MRRVFMLSVGIIASVGLACSSFVTAGASVAPAPGYWVATSQGAAFPYGGASSLFGPASVIHGLHAPIVGILATPARDGYWMFAADGGVFAFGHAPFFGSMGGVALNAPIVAMASTADGRGYWLADADGGVFAFGDAPFKGASSNPDIFGHIAGILGSPDGLGYALITRTGVVLSFATAARFFPQHVAIANLRGPIVGVVPAASGYWMVAADGGVFARDGAAFLGSLGNLCLNAPIVGITATHDGLGYWLAGADGGVFSFGDAAFHGSTGGVSTTQTFVGITAS